jgi:hypothetical protein
MNRTNRLMIALGLGVALSVFAMWDVAKDAIAETAHPAHHAAVSSSSKVASK